VTRCYCLEADLIRVRWTTYNNHYLLTLQVLAVSLLAGQLYACYIGETDAWLDPQYYVPSNVTINSDWCSPGEHFMPGTMSLACSASVCLPQACMSTVKHVHDAG
jgi:hypothetical protein